MLFRKKARSEEAAAAAPGSPQPTPAAAHVDDGTETDVNDEPKAVDLAPVNTTATEDIVYPSGLRLALLLTSAFVSLFLVSLVSLGSPPEFFFLISRALSLSLCLCDLYG